MESKTSKGQMAWWQLSLLGVGCTLGTGFFSEQAWPLQRVDLLF